MILSDNWLIANNYAALRFEMTRQDLPAGDNTVNYLYREGTIEQVRQAITSRLFGRESQAVLTKLDDLIQSNSQFSMNWTDGSQGSEVRYQLRRAPDGGKPIIYPFHPESVKVTEDGRRVTSYGLSSYGYDVTLAPRFKLFTNINSGVIDPLDFTDENCVDFVGESVVVPPNSYMLGVTNEYFCIPDDVMVIAIGKSTYARAGAIVNVTPIEPGFEGNVVIEISNATPSPLRIHANMGIAQFCFLKGDQPAKTNYRHRAGKYQGQTGITLAKV